MLARVASVVVLASAAFAWAPVGHTMNRRQRVVVEGGRVATPIGRTSTPAGKAIVVENVRAAVDASSLAWSFKGDELNIKSINALRKKLPEGTKAMMVKNTLMSKVLAVDDPLLAKSNLWILSGEDMKGSMTAFNDWAKEHSKSNGLEADAFAVRGGILDGQILDSASVKAVIDLPSKPELMARLGAAINNAGVLGIATSLKNARGNPRGIAVRLREASGGKLFRAVKIGAGDAEKNLATA